jgi:hypothetical protein
MKHKCWKCGKEGAVWLSYRNEGGLKRVFGLFGFHYESFTSRPLCTTDFTEEFGLAFKLCSFRYVVFPPITRGGYLTSGYDYEPLQSKTLSRQQAIASVAISYAAGSCAICNRPASVAYFAHEFFEYLFEATPGHSIDRNPPTSYCKECTLDRIVPVLVANCAEFVEGIDIPNGGDGIYFPRSY